LNLGTNVFHFGSLSPCFSQQLRAAISRNLQISYDSRIGWSITEPTEALIDFIVGQGWTDIHMGRDEGRAARGTGPSISGGGPAVTPKPSSTRKYQCPTCGASVRATRDVNLICGDCFQRMVVV
jgi:DNA-directed RNA polymerase subunit RPC12/RpoP